MINLNEHFTKAHFACMRWRQERCADLAWQRCEGHADAHAFLQAGQGGEAAQHGIEGGEAAEIHAGVSPACMAKCCICVKACTNFFSAHVC